MFFQDKYSYLKQPLNFSIIAVAAREMAQQKSVDELAKFDKGQLKHAETAEKNVLPGPDDIKAEKDHNKHVDGIEKFDKVRSLSNPAADIVTTTL